MKVIKVTVERQVVETWHYEIEVPNWFPSTSDTLDDEKLSEAKRALYKCVEDNSQVVDSVHNDSACTELTIGDW